MPEGYESWEQTEVKTGRFMVLCKITGYAPGYLSLKAGEEVEVYDHTAPGEVLGCPFVFCTDSLEKVCKIVRP